jgi:hypothetical protein
VGHGETLGGWGNPWGNLWKIHGKLWNSIKNPWKSLKNLWENVGNLWNLTWSFVKFDSKSVGHLEILWLLGRDSIFQLEIYENLWESMELENLWKMDRMCTFHLHNLGKLMRILQSK